MRTAGQPCAFTATNSRRNVTGFSEFKTGQTTILVATDVAAQVSTWTTFWFVINYDYPNNSEDYIHRIEGRTGRKETPEPSPCSPQAYPEGATLCLVWFEAKQVVNPSCRSSSAVDSAVVVADPDTGGGGGGRS